MSAICLQKGAVLEKVPLDLPGGGFMETVFFGVEWLSEDKIRMTYDDLNDKYDEQFIIEIP